VAGISIPQNTNGYGIRINIVSIANKIKIFGLLNFEYLKLLIIKNPTITIKIIAKYRLKTPLKINEDKRIPVVGIGNPTNPLKSNSSTITLNRVRRRTPQITINNETIANK